MNPLAAQVYQRVSVDTGVASSDPHALVLMLFDAALAAIHQAEGHVAAGRVEAKGQAIGKAARIVEEGLKASLDKNAGGALSQQLAALYDYITMRLLQANLNSNAAALAEAGKLLADLRNAWTAIRPAESIATAPQPARAYGGAAPAPARARLAVSA